MVGIYSMMTAKLFFPDQRPALLPAALGFGFGEILHIIVFFTFGVNDPQYIIATIYDTMVLSLFGAALSGALVSIACRSWGNLVTNLLNSTMLIFLAFDLCCLTVLFVALEDAQRQTSYRLMQGMQDLQQNLFSQIRYMLRRSALSLRELPEIRDYTQSDLE